MSKLNEIGLKLGTDKSSKIHGYLKKYEKYLPYNREEPLKILEIGVLNGESLRTLKEYFFNSEIVGIDINPDCKLHEEERINIEIGSQVDNIFLDNVIEKYGQFDMIIDDGSHINSHIIYSFKKLFDVVKPQGIYIAEDICTSYWEDYGGKLRTKGSAIEFFKEVIDEVNYFGELQEHYPNVHARNEETLDYQFKLKGYNYIGTKIESINFMNGFVLITKK
jgi:hypothetical protein